MTHLLYNVFPSFSQRRNGYNKENLSSLELEKFFQICACVISTQKAKHLDTTTMFTYSHANTPLSQSEHAYYLSYFIKGHNSGFSMRAGSRQNSLAISRGLAAYFSLEISPAYTNIMIKSRYQNNQWFIL